MAVPRSARVTKAEKVAPDTRLLEVSVSESLGFLGGQYTIVDSGLVLPNGKAVKRAYSILTPDREQNSFQLAVKRIPDGPGSRYLHDLSVGTEIRFSGPWGKFYAAEDASGPALVFATDTGITAALGLVRSARFLPLLSKTAVIWLRSVDDYFLPEALVRERIPRQCGEVRIDVISPIGDPGRIPRSREIVSEVLSSACVEQAFVCGDGAVNYALFEDLLQAGVRVSKDSLESFFNLPGKRA